MERFQIRKLCSATGSGFLELQEQQGRAPTRSNARPYRAFSSVPAPSTSGVPSNPHLRSPCFPPHRCPRRSVLLHRQPRAQPPQPATQPRSTPVQHQGVGSQAPPARRLCPGPARVQRRHGPTCPLTCGAHEEAPRRANESTQSVLTGPPVLPSRTNASSCSSTSVFSPPSVAMRFDCLPPANHRIRREWLK